jgi:hypothetical protein
MTNEAIIKKYERVKTQYEKQLKDAVDAIEDALYYGDDMTASYIVQSVEMFSEQIETLEWEIEKLKAVGV